jgi:hypothetical protein
VVTAGLVGVTMFLVGVVILVGLSVYVVVVGVVTVRVVIVSGVGIIIVTVVKTCFRTYKRRRFIGGTSPSS